MSTNNRTQIGFTLIEVLVSLLIFSFGIIGLVALQARATQISYDSEDRMRASLMANEIIALMWEQKTVLLPPATITAWQARVANATVSGLSNVTTDSISTDSNGVTWIQIVWQAPSHSTPSQYITQIQMP